MGIDCNTLLLTLYCLLKSRNKPPLQPMEIVPRELFPFTRKDGVILKQEIDE